MKKTALIIMMMVVAMTIGCATTGSNKTDSDFPFDQVGKTWDGGDGFIYTVATGSSRDMQQSVNKASMSCRTQIVRFLNLQEATLRNSREVRREITAGGGQYTSYVQMSIRKADNPELFR